MEGTINIELVANGLRDAYLPDLSKEKLAKLIEYANDLGVKYVSMPKGNSVFVRDEEIAKSITNRRDLGKSLGYYCYNQYNWDDTTKHRQSVDVIERNTNTLIYREMCNAQNLNLAELEEYYHNKLDVWNNTLPQYNFEVVITYKYAPEQLLHIDNYNEFNRLRDAYISILDKHWYKQSRMHKIITNLNETDFNEHWVDISNMILTMLPMGNRPKKSKREFMSDLEMQLLKLFKLTNQNGISRYWRQD